MARPRIVSLFTDFGTTDVYAGVVRGLIRTMAPEAEVLDVTHGIAPGDRHEAAFMLLSAVPFLPRGSIHLCIVDPGVGTERRIIAVRAAGHTFVGPDNGCLAPVVDALGGAAELRYVTNEKLQRRRRSEPFHGRDVMAPVVAHLVRGINFANVGEQAESLVLLPGFEPEQDGDVVRGRVLHTDRFGNLATNLLLDEVPGLGRERVLAVDGTDVPRLGKTFADVGPGELVVYVGSVGFLEVGVRDGNAAERLQAGNGTLVTARKTT